MAHRSRSSKRSVGQLPPRYKFVLNPYKDVRFSKCPGCDRSTHTRKFPLLIHVNDFGPVVMGKTCRYCTRCEIIIAHQDELEAELAGMFSRLTPEVIGNDYFVLGTVEKNAWRRGMSASTSLEDILAHTAEFQEHLDVKYEPAGWVPGQGKDA